MSGSPYAGEAAVYSALARGAGASDALSRYLQRHAIRRAGVPAQRPRRVGDPRRVGRRGQSSNFVSALVCSLQGAQRLVTPVPGTRFAELGRRAVRWHPLLQLRRRPRALLSPYSSARAQSSVRPLMTPAPEVLEIPGRRLLRHEHVPAPSRRLDGRANPSTRARVPQGLRGEMSPPTSARHRAWRTSPTRHLLRRQPSPERGMGVGAQARPGTAPCRAGIWQVSRWHLSQNRS